MYLGNDNSYPVATCLSGFIIMVLAARNKSAAGLRHTRKYFRVLSLSRKLGEVWSGCRARLRELAPTMNASTLPALSGSYTDSLCLA